MNAQTVSRDRVVELLNLMDCHDCHKSPKEVVDTLTESRWNDFRVLPGKNFADIPLVRQVAGKMTNTPLSEYRYIRWNIKLLPARKSANVSLNTTVN